MTDFLQEMETATLAGAPVPPKPVASGPVDWYAFRRRHPDIGIGKTGEDGSLEEWQSILREVGQDRLTTAIIKARSAGRKGDRIWFSRVLEYLPESSNSPVQGAPAPKKSNRSRIDLLVWCICHSARCYADALYPWKPLPQDDSVPTMTIVGRMKRVPMEDPLTPERRAQIEGLARKARLELLHQCGLEDDAKWNTMLYNTAKATPRLMAWLRAQRLIPSPE